MLAPAEAAWAAVIPAALLTVGAVVMLGPLFGRAFLSPGPESFWPEANPWPQPAEHGRFLVGLVVVPLVSAAVLASRRMPLHLPPRAIATLVRAGRIALLGFVAVCLAAQNNIVFSADFPLEPHTAYFTAATLAAAGAAALLVPWLLGRPGATQLLARLGLETRALRVACALIAALATAVWLLTAINLDSSIGFSNEAVLGHIQSPMNEPFAILDGRTPLVDFRAQYSQVWPYIAAVPLAVLGATVGVYTLVMAGISLLAMLAVHALLRRTARSPLLGLALFLPFLASSFFTVIGPPEDRFSPANLYMAWPGRFAGPYLLAWLTARALDGDAPRLPFFAGGLVVVNNPEFGVAALVATLAASACARPPASGRAAARLVGGALLGVVTALVLVSLLTLVRAGALPRLGLLFEFSRLYGLDGWAALPMPELGLHLVVFLTFAAALIVALVRAVTRSRDVLVTGMLAWSGVFGLLGVGYFVGRAHPGALFDLLSPWSLALGLLLLVVVRALAARGWHRPTAPELAVLFAFGVAACSLAQIPTPWSQIARLRDRTPTPVLEQREAVRLVSRTTRTNEHVAILMTLSHRVAFDAGVINVAPYSSIELMPTREQLNRVVRQLRAEHVCKLYISSRSTTPPEQRTLERAGFSSEQTESDFKELIASWC